MSQIDFGYWLLLPETTKIRQDIQEELNKLDKEILDGYMLSSTKLDRMYARAIGKREGLLLVQKIIDVEKDNNEDKDNEIT